MFDTLEVIRTICTIYGFIIILHNSLEATKSVNVTKPVDTELRLNMEHSLCSNCSSMLIDDSINKSSSNTRSISTQTNMIDNIDPNCTKYDINNKMVYHDGPYITPEAYQAVGILL